MQVPLSFATNCTMNFQKLYYHYLLISFLSKFKFHVDNSANQKQKKWINKMRHTFRKKKSRNRSHGWEWKIFVLLKNKKISSRGPGATQALVGFSHSFLHLFFFSSASISRALVVSLRWRNSMFQSLELLKEKKEEISRGVRGHAPPGKFWKSRLKSVQSKAFWRQIWRNLAH